MRNDVDRMLARCSGVATRSLLYRQGLSRSALDNEVRNGALVAIAPETYCRPWDADDVAVRERGALISVGSGASLSHLTAVRRWDLPGAAPADGATTTYLTVPSSRNPRSSSSDIVIHRVDRYPPVVRLNGLVTVTAATAIVTSWPMVRGIDERAAAITGVRQKLVTPADLRASVELHRRLHGRRPLLQLIDLLDAGCESELEIWGHLTVFDHPGLRHAVRQRVMRINGKKYRLDQAYERERVAVEMDGQAYHSSPEQRERDMRRDAALATQDWLTLRYSHYRLHTDIPGCRGDTLAVLDARRH